MSRMAHHQILVLGGGLAGLRAVIGAHDTGCDVAVVSKVYPIRSHSCAGWRQAHGLPWASCACRNCSQDRLSCPATLTR